MCNKTSKIQPHKQPSDVKIQGIEPLAALYSHAANLTPTFFLTRRQIYTRTIGEQKKTSIGRVGATISKSKQYNEIYLKLKVNFNQRFAL